MWICFFAYVCNINLIFQPCTRCAAIIAHLVYSGQRACLLPVPIIVSPQWAPVPQGAFLPQSIIQNVILLTPLALKSIEIHGGLHGRLVLKAPSCPAAAALQWVCGPPLLCSQQKMCQSGNPRHVTAVVDLHVSYTFPVPPSFSLSWEGLSCCFEKREGHSHFFAPSFPLFYFRN